MRKLALLLVACGVVSASAAILWDQSNYNSSLVAFVDQEFPDYPTYSTYQVHDVVSTGWTVQSVSTYFTYGYGNWSGVTQARLNYVAHTGGTLPPASYDPSTGTVVNITKVNLGDAWKVTASGLNINLGAGTWWVGLTPIAAFGQFGQEFHQCIGTVTGFYSAVRNPGGGFGLGTAWGTYALFGYAPDDGAILVEGVLPEPSSLLLLGLAALIRRR